MPYKLVANDETEIYFCKHQLKLMEFPRSALTDLKGDWIPDSECDELPVPGLSGKMLKLVADWSEIACEVPESKQNIRIPSIIKTPSQFMKHGCESTNVLFKYHPPLINSKTVWDTKHLGCAQELLDWIEHIRTENSIGDILELVDAADFMGAPGLVELTAGKIAHEMIQRRDEVYRQLYKNINRFQPLTVEKLENFRKWLSMDKSEAILPDDWQFFHDVQEYFEKYPYIKRIVLHFQRHRGPEIPREGWGEVEWLSIMGERNIVLIRECDGLQ
jgi:hypothetical protein